MRAIFVSYRRSDSQGEAGRLFDDLVSHFGEQKVFMDVSGIEAGADFRKAIEESVASCGVLLVVMGPAWVSAKEESGVRRLDDPADFVREEVAAALRRGIPVIPVLVRGATMPRADELPESLKDLAYRNCVELTHARWKSDVQVLFDSLRRLVGGSREVKAVSGAVRVAGSGGAEAASAFDAASLQRVSRELAQDIGPIAEVVVKRAAALCNSTEELCNKVAEEIESPAQREAFLRRMNAGSSAATSILAEGSAVSKSSAVASATSKLEPVAPTLRPGQKKSSIPLVIVAALVLLVVALVVGRKILAPQNSGSTAGTTNQEGESHPSHEAAIPAPGSKTEPSATIPASETLVLKRVRLQPEVASELLVSKVAPAYPDLARQAHIQGIVVLDADIAKDGEIENIRTVSGHPMLIPAAIDAVKQWKYRPYKQNGEPVPVQTQIKVAFTLKNG